jgi:hypothetical protein
MPDLEDSFSYPLEDPDEERFLAGEVLVDGGLGDSRLESDIRGARHPIVGAGEDLGRGAEYLKLTLPGR